MAAVAGLRTATSMLYYSAQRYDPQLKQQQQPTLLSSAPHNIPKHPPTSFTAREITYPPSISSRRLPSTFSTLIGVSNLLINGSITSTSNRGSSSQWRDEHSGRISALTNNSLFESDDTGLTSSAGDDPAALVKEPEPEEQRTPSIESMLGAIQLAERAIKAPNPVVPQSDDKIEEIPDESGKIEEVSVAQVSTGPENSGLTLETGNSPSDILDQHPEYDSMYDSSDSFFAEEDLDDVDDSTYSFGQSISTLDIRASISSNHGDNVAPPPTRSPSVASSCSSVSSIQFRPVEPSTSRRRASIPSIVYERRVPITPRRSTAFRPNDTTTPHSSRRVSFVDPLPVPSSAQKSTAWWKVISQRHSRSSTCFCSGRTASRQRSPEPVVPDDVPSQSISPAVASIATSGGDVGSHLPPVPPPPPQSPAHSTRRRRTRVNVKEVVSAMLSRIAISRQRQACNELGEDKPKEKSRSNSVFLLPWGRRLKKSKDNAKGQGC